MKACLLLSAVLIAAPAVAQDMSAFHPGTAIPDHGPIATIVPDDALSEDAAFAVAFDVAEAAEPGAKSRALESPARLLNMLVEAGVPAERVDLAIVVHGGASKDLLASGAYAARHDGAENGSAALLKALMAAGIEVYLCGQSAAAHGIAKDDLVPGIRMSLSAMTAHARLQQAGYTLNPF